MGENKKKIIIVKKKKKTGKSETEKERESEGSRTKWRMWALVCPENKQRDRTIGEAPGIILDLTDHL